MCVLAYNCVEWLEIYAAAALAGVVVVPINFRLTGPEVQYIVDNCDARALIVQDELVGVAESVRTELPIAESHFVHFGATSCPSGYKDYESLLAQARDSRPTIDIAGGDPWTLMYTSGTTGKPKGAIRNHKGGAMLSLVKQCGLISNFGRGPPECYGLSQQIKPRGKGGEVGAAFQRPPVHNVRFTPESCRRLSLIGAAKCNSGLSASLHPI